MRRRTAHKFLLVAAMGLLGCGGGAQAPKAADSMAKATVSGTITAKGKPIKSGTVTFNPANANRKNVSPVMAKVGDGGKYQLETYVGTNAVQVTTRDAGSAAGSGFSDSFDAKEGENTYDIEMVH